MFLITTADQRFWKTDDKILFLGEWCKLYSQKHVWSQLDYETVPYHWDDRERLYQDYLYLRQVYQRTLPLLAQSLNHVHGLNYSTRYWQIIIGRWLSFFIELLYDRYLSIQVASQTSQVDNTWVTNQWPLELVIKNYWDLAMLCNNDSYNHYLYSRIIVLLDSLPYEVVKPVTRPNLRDAIIVQQTNSKWRGVKKTLEYLLGIYQHYLPYRRNTVAFVNDHLPRKAKLELELSLGQWPSLHPPWLTPPMVAPNPDLRQRLTLSSASQPFENLLRILLVEQLPTAYLESYRVMNQQALATYPRQSQLIVTSNIDSGSTGLKFWAAYQIEKQSARLITSQHGGHYGCGRWFSSEENEVNISDRYYTWGWQTPHQPKTIPMPGGPLIKYRASVKPNLSGDILWVTMTIPRYAYHMYSLPVGPQMKQYIVEQKRFLYAVSPKVRSLLLLRPYSLDYGWDLIARLQPEIQQIKISQRRQHIISELDKSRLVVTTYNATTFLQTFVANYPTLMFWNPYYWELRHTAQPFFEHLRRVGILHDTPEAAAIKLNEIYQDPLAWWHSPAVQSAKDNFCYQFARVDKNWRYQWQLGLETELQLKDSDKRL